MIEPWEYTVRYLDDLPLSVPGVVALSPDGHYNIYINAKLSRDGQREAIGHELEHIENDDFYNDDDIRTIEARADRKHTSLKHIPQLMKARDLIPTYCEQERPRKLVQFDADYEPRRRSNRPLTEAETKPVPQHLTQYQRKVIIQAITEFDRMFFGGNTIENWMVLG